MTVHKLGMELPSYHVCQGGHYIGFQLPLQEVQPGDEVGLSFQLLSVEDFARSIPSIVLTNSALEPWLANTAILKDFKVTDGSMDIEVIQDNPWSDVGGYTISGQVVKYPGTSGPLWAIYPEIAISDYAGRARDLRIRYDGFSSASIAIEKAPTYPLVSLVSFDGMWLNFAYDTNVATVYIEAPSSSIYGLGTMESFTSSYLDLVQGKYTNAYQVDRVDLERSIEQGMLARGGTYDLGIMGSEIAYVIATKDLGLKNLIIEAPSKPGRDLYTQDNTVAIQTRLLTDFTHDSRHNLISQALYDLSEKLQEDYQNQPQMRDGYAILTYLSPDGSLKSIILEVPKW